MTATSHSSLVSSSDVNGTECVQPRRHTTFGFIRPPEVIDKPIRQGRLCGNGLLGGFLASAKNTSSAVGKLDYDTLRRFRNRTSHRKSKSKARRTQPTAGKRIGELGITRTHEHLHDPQLFGSDPRT